MANSSEEVEEENLFIVTEFCGFLSAVFVPQRAHAGVFDRPILILTNWSYILCKCEEKTGATKVDAV